MKHELEPWREVLLQVNSLLKWDQKFYPAIIFAINTFIFLVLWYLDMPLLTAWAMVLFVAVGIDFVYPIVSKIVVKSSNWTGDNEKVFEEVCMELCEVRNKIHAAYNKVFVPKEERTTCYMIAMVGSLLGMAWIGANIDNLLLSYLVALFLSMYPGLLKNGIVSLVKDKVMTVVSTHFKTVKQRVSDINKKTE